MIDFEKVRLAGINLDKIGSIVLIKATLINKAPLRVGKSAGEFGDVDLPLEKLPDRTPYIPGSSLKGCLRSLAERISPRSCDIFSPLSECEVAALTLRKALQSPNDLRRILEELLRSRIERTKAEKAHELVSKLLDLASEGEEYASDVINEIVEEGLPCPVCRLFGNKELASHVLVRDATPISKPPVSYRTRVAIDRFRRAARAQALFTYEFVPPGVEWNLDLKVYNVGLDGKNEASKLLLALLKYLRKFGLEVGGMRSTGHGAMEVKTLQARIYRVQDFEVKEAGIHEF